MKNKKRITKLLFLSVCLSIVFLAVACSSKTSPAKDKPLQPTEIQKLMTFSKPGIVLIESYVEGTVTMPTFTIHGETGEFIPVSHGLPLSLRTWAGATGSGFVIAPNGYIVTNAHVIGTQNDHEWWLLDSASQIITSQLLDEMYAQSGITASIDLTANILQQMDKYLQKHAKLSNVQKKITTLLGANIPGISRPQEFRASLQKFGDPELGSLDLALLKVEQNNLPTLKFGDSESVTPPAQIYAVGYPGSILEATGTEKVFSPEGLTEPTFTSGIITSKRTTNKGIVVFGIDAAIQQGNSGGPSLNEHGEVLGVNTFGIAQRETSNFIIPVNVVKEFIKQANVENKAGPVDEYYQKGLEYYWAGEYTKAKESLEIVRNLFPGHPYINQFLPHIQEKLLPGSKTTGNIVVAKPHFELRCDHTLVQIRREAFPAIGGCISTTDKETASENPS